MPGSEGLLRELRRFVRMHEWHPGKIPLVLGFVFLSSLAAPQSVDAHWVGLAYLFSCLYLANGYMLNNLADTEQDIVANKNRGFMAWSFRAKAIPVLLFVALSLGLGVALLSHVAAAALFGCYGLAWAYSFPPRLKEHVLLGPLVAAFAQAPAPALVLALAWGALPPAAGCSLLVAFLYGLRMILVHQILDHDNDVRTATRTTATVLGLAAVRRLLRVVFGAELLGTAALVAVAARTPMPAALLACLAWPLALAVLRWRRGEPLGLDNYAYIPLADIHESLLPLLFAAALALRDGGVMVGVCLLMVLLFANRHLDRLVRPITRWEQHHA